MSRAVSFAAVVSVCAAFVACSGKASTSATETPSATASASPVPTTAPPAAASSAPAVAAPGAAIFACDGKPDVRPVEIVIACGDGNYGLKKLVWRTWGTPSARATGSAYLNDCQPYCAKGHFHDYPATAEVSSLGRINGRVAYTRLVVSAPGHKQEVYALSCEGPIGEGQIAPTNCRH